MRLRKDPDAYQRLLDGNAVQALLDHADRLGAHRELPGDLRCHRRHGLADVHDLHAELGLVERATVGDGPVGGGELQRRHEQVALADRHLDRVARKPDVVRERLGVRLVLVLQPGVVGHPSRLLTGDLEAGGRTEAEVTGKCLELLALARPEPLPEGLSEVVEDSVATLDEGLLEGDGPAVDRLPVVERLVVEADLGWAGKGAG